MGRAVAAHQAGPVHGEYHRQVLQGDVVNELIIGALQESRIDRHYGLEPLGRQAGGKGDRVLFGDRDVVVALGESLREFNQARAFAHRGCDADDAGIAFGHLAQPLAEYLRVGRPAARLLEDHAAGRIERSRSMPLDGVRLGGRVALALAGNDVQKLRSAQFLQIAQGTDQGFDVVAVDGADIVEAHFLE